MAASADQRGIVPDLRELIALRGLLAGRRPPRRGHHGHAGHGLSLQRGRGMEYAESREYAIGDDARHIDWRLTARSGRTHTKLFQAERERLTLLVADTAPVLYFGTRERYKSVQAARIGAVATWRALRDGDRLAAVRGSHHAARVPALGGVRGALQVVGALADWYARPPPDDAGLTAALEQARRLLRPGARCIVLADAAAVVAVPVALWAGLRLHAGVHVLLLADAFELAPPLADIVFQSPAAASLPLRLDLTAVAQRGRWDRRFAQTLQAAHATLQARGIGATTVMTGDAPDAWLADLHRRVP